MPDRSPRRSPAPAPDLFVARYAAGQWSSAAGRDALALALVAATMLVLAHWFDLFEHLVAWGRRWAVADAPDLIVTVLVLAFALKVYAWRRWREARRATAFLRRERDFADAIVGTAGALILVLDRHGRIVGFNRACEALTGYAAAEVTGRPFWELFLLPAEAARVRAVFADLCAGRYPDAHENYWVARDGARHLIAWRNTALLDDTGTVAHVVAIGLDVTAQRAAADELAVARTELAGQADDLRRLRAKLSPQEWRVLALLAAGLTYDAIGARLHVGGETVKTHVGRIGEKLGCGRRRDDVLAAAGAQGLLDRLSPDPPQP